MSYKERCTYSVIMPVCVCFVLCVCVLCVCFVLCVCVFCVVCVCFVLCLCVVLWVCVLCCVCVFFVLCVCFLLWVCFLCCVLCVCVVCCVCVLCCVCVCVCVCVCFCLPAHLTAYHNQRALPAINQECVTRHIKLFVKMITSLCIAREFESHAWRHGDNSRPSCSSQRFLPYSCFWPLYNSSWSLSL
jgi:hypothetical protein